MCFRCYQKTLHYNAMSLKFQNLCEFRHEVKIMNTIAEQPEHISQELFLQVMQTVPLAERPANCLILENLPLLETCIREESPLTGGHLKALAVQLASGLQFLHSLGFWHADIRNLSSGATIKAWPRSVALHWPVPARWRIRSLSSRRPI